MTCAAILLLGTSCATATVPADRAANPFCTVVGPPPPEMIPAAGEPFGWIDKYLATFDVTCR